MMSIGFLPVKLNEFKWIKSRERTGNIRDKIMFWDVNSYHSCHIFHSIYFLSNSALHVGIFGVFIFATAWENMLKNFILCYFWDFYTKLGILLLEYFRYSFCGGRDLAQCCCLNIFIVHKVVVAQSTRIYTDLCYDRNYVYLCVVLGIVLHSVYRSAHRYPFFDPHTTPTFMQENFNLLCSMCMLLFYLS